MNPSTNLPPPLASGRTADIYPWHGQQILKLFHPSRSEAAVAAEVRMARAVQATGLPVPAVGQMCQVEGRWGIEYERVQGPTMAAAMMARPWRIGRYARLLAELQIAIHEVRGLPGLPSQHDRLRDKIARAPALPAALRRQALAQLAQMPPGDSLCHNDFHPENVLLGPAGPVVVDWPDATLGPPAADVARTAVLLAGELLPGRTPSLAARLGLRWCYRAYLAHIFRRRPGSRDAVARWRPLVAAGRLSEGIEGLGEWLLQQAAA